MSARTGHDNATIAIGLVSLASLASLALTGDLRFAVVSGASIGVAIVLGFLAVVAGVAKLPWLSVATGAAFVAAAVLQVVLVTIRATWLGGNTSTSALWLGLGIALVVFGLTRVREQETARSEPMETR